MKDILGNWGLCIERNVIEVIGRRHDGPNLLFSMDKNAKPTLKAGPDFSRESARGVYEPVRLSCVTTFSNKVFILLGLG